MIPDEAVEAAAKVFYEDGWAGPPFWESLDVDDPSRLEYLVTTRIALEAAAPHMVQAIRPEGSCPTRLMDGRNEIRCWLPAGHDGACK